MLKDSYFFFLTIQYPMLKLCVSLAYDMSTMNLFLFQRVNNNMDSFLIKVQHSHASSFSCIHFFLA